MSKDKALENCIYMINEYGYISYDGILDECDEDVKLVKYCIKQLQKLIGENKLIGELDI